MAGSSGPPYHRVIRPVGRAYERYIHRLVGAFGDGHLLAGRVEKIAPGG